MKNIEEDDEDELILKFPKPKIITELFTTETINKMIKEERNRILQKLANEFDNALSLSWHSYEIRDRLLDILNNEDKY